MEELRYENMDLQNVRHILLFYISQNINEPLKVFVRRANPQEVYLKNNLNNYHLSTL